jgi:hypothetical protein
MLYGRRTLKAISLRPQDIYVRSGDPDQHGAGRFLRGGVPSHGGSFELSLAYGK